MRLRGNLERLVLPEVRHATLEGRQAAFPALGGILVVTAPGHWYEQKGQAAARSMKLSCLAGAPRAKAGRLAASQTRNTSTARRDALAHSPENRISSGPRLGFRR